MNTTQFTRDRRCFFLCCRSSTFKPIVCRFVCHPGCVWEYQWHPDWEHHRRLRRSGVWSGLELHPVHRVTVLWLRSGQRFKGTVEFGRFLIPNPWDNVGASFPEMLMFIIIITLTHERQMKYIIVGDDSSDQVPGQVVGFSYLNTAGVFVASLSSAFGFLTSAPKIFQVTLRKQNPQTTLLLIKYKTIKWIWIKSFLWCRRIFFFSQSKAGICVYTLFCISGVSEQRNVPVIKHICSSVSVSVCAETTSTRTLDFLQRVMGKMTSHSGPISSATS